jgi:L-rhamnose mutarotase
MVTKYSAFKMNLLPDQKQEYKNRHDEIWPALSALLKKVGICDYHIYLDDETDILFAFYKIENDSKLKDLPQQDIMIKWWEFMADIMETMPSNEPVSRELSLMFYME